MLSRLFRSTPLRLTVLLGSGFLLSLVLSGGLAYWLIAGELRARLDTTIADTTTVIRQAYGENNENDATDLVDTVNSHIRATVGFDQVFLLRDPSGHSAAGNVTKGPSATGWSTVEATVLGLPPSSGSFRVSVTPIGQYSLLVGASYSETDAVGRLIFTGIGWAGALLLVLMVLAGAAVTVGGQRRLDRIADVMGRVSRGELNARIDVSGRGDDIDALMTEMNGALDRLAALVEGMRQVSVDIAHDLKSPLNRLSITLEGALGAAEPLGPAAEGIMQAQTEIRQLNGTFEALLRVANIEAGAGRSRFTVLTLQPIITTLDDAYGEVAKEQGQTLETTIGAGTPELLGDRELLTQLIANLVENAMRHGPAGTRIVVRTFAVAGCALLEVSDNGPGIPKDERDKVFRRLYRLEKSRTTPGSGLGLSLVKAIADLHGASVKLHDNVPGLRVTVKFPPVKQPGG